MIIILRHQGLEQSAGDGPGLAEAGGDSVDVLEPGALGLVHWVLLSHHSCRSQWINWFGVPALCVLKNKMWVVLSIPFLLRPEFFVYTSGHTLNGLGASSSGYFLNLGLANMAAETLFSCLTWRRVPIQGALPYSASSSEMDILILIHLKTGLSRFCYHPSSSSSCFSDRHVVTSPPTGSPRVHPVGMGVGRPFCSIPASKILPMDSLQNQDPLSML